MSDDTSAIPNEPTTDAAFLDVDEADVRHPLRKATTSRTDRRARTPPTSGLAPMTKTRRSPG